MLSLPPELLQQEFDLGRVEVTADMIAAYRHAVGDEADSAEAPPTFCLGLRRGMTPNISLPPDTFGVYGGHDLEFFRPICAGGVYHIRGRIADVYEKIGRTGTLTIIVREVTIDDEHGLVARVVERQIIRQRPASAS